MSNETSKAYKDAIDDILRQREKVAHLQEGIKEAVKVIAERFDQKPAQVNKVIAMVEKEREKGGVVEEHHQLLDQVESIILQGL